MTSAGVRATRADASRNVELLVRTASQVFRDDGPQATLEAVARRAGLGTRTLYRHFPSRDRLIQAVLDVAIAEQLAPAVSRANASVDPLQGLSDLLGDTLAMVSGERHVIAAAHDARAITDRAVEPVLSALAELTARARRAGAVRSDVTAGDVHQLLGMLTSTVWSSAPDDRTWRRALQLTVDGLDPRVARSLPGVAAHAHADPAAECWPPS